MELYLVMAFFKQKCKVSIFLKICWQFYSLNKRIYFFTPGQSWAPTSSFASTHQWCKGKNYAAQICKEFPSSITHLPSHVSPWPSPHLYHPPIFTTLPLKHQCKGYRGARLRVEFGCQGGWQGLCSVDAYISVGNTTWRGNADTLKEYDACPALDNVVSVHHVGVEKIQEKGS